VWLLAREIRSTEKASANLALRLAGPPFQFFDHLGQCLDVTLYILRAAKGCPRIVFPFPMKRARPGVGSNRQRGGAKKKCLFYGVTKNKNTLLSYHLPVEGFFGNCIDVWESRWSRSEKKEIVQERSDAGA
jgi:hypothetical protein